MDIELIPYDSKDYTVDIQVVKELPKKIVSYRELFKKMAEEEKAKERAQIDEDDDEPIDINPFSKLIIKEPPIHHSTNNPVTSHIMLKAATAQNEKNANFASTCQQDVCRKGNDNEIDNNDSTAVERVKFSVTPVDEFAEYGTNQGIVQDILINHCHIITNTNNNSPIEHSSSGNLDNNIPRLSDEHTLSSATEDTQDDQTNNEDKFNLALQVTNESPVITKEFSIDANYQPYLYGNSEEFYEDVSDGTVFDTEHNYFYYDDASSDAFDLDDMVTNEEHLPKTISNDNITDTESSGPNYESNNDISQNTELEKDIISFNSKEQILLDDNENNISEFINKNHLESKNILIENKNITNINDKLNLGEYLPQNAVDILQPDSLESQDQLVESSVDNKKEQGKHSKADICYTNGPTPERHHRATLESIKEERSINMSFDDNKNTNEEKIKRSTTIEENEVDPSSESISMSDKSNTSILMPVKGHLEWKISDCVQSSQPEGNLIEIEKLIEHTNICENSTEQRIYEQIIEPKTKEIGIQTEYSFQEIDTQQCTCSKNKSSSTKKLRKSQKQDRLCSSSSNNSISEQFLNIFKLAEGFSSDDKSITDTSEGNYKDFTQSTNLDCSSSLDSFEIDENSVKLENNNGFETDEMKSDENL